MQKVSKPSKLPKRTSTELKASLLQQEKDSIVQNHNLSELLSPRKRKSAEMFRTSVSV